MAKISKLDPILSSQIAAGEVVERPASVVKELAENSLDAGARRIIIEFSDDGLSCIKISDDGSGMSIEDALMSVQRFATSKIGSLSDLISVSSLGFRGEALPSIASCSKLTISTWDGEGDGGFTVETEGGKIVNEYSSALPKGTTVTCKDLFFNTPARLKFLRSKTGERRLIIDTVQRLALSWPNVSFTLQSSGKTILRTGGSGLENALVDIFGPDTQGNMVPLDYENQGIKVTGFLGRPNLYRRARDRQFFSVHKRPIRSLTLSFSLDDAFKGIIPPNTRPFCILDISLDHESLDVNVHPTKSEVRFKDERKIRSNVMQAARHALREIGQITAEETSHTGIPSGSFERRSVPTVFGNREMGPRIWSQPTMVRDMPQGRDGLPQGWEYLGSILDTYLVASSPDSLLVIDKHALMESLAYMELQTQRSGKQDLLVSEIVKLDPLEASAYEDMEKEIQELGFTSRLIGERTLLVTAVPTLLGKPMPAPSVKEVLAGIKQEGRDLMTAACHASVRARESLSAEEAVALILGLIRTPEARTCPHGRPTVKEFTSRELDLFFGRNPKPGDTQF